MDLVSRNKVLLEKLEPYLTVRHYYVLAVKWGLIESPVRSVIGHDHKRVLRGAAKALRSIDLKKSPLLRPEGVWTDRIEYAARFSSSFSRLLINHGIEPSELHLLKSNKLEKYCKFRLLGMDQKSACRESGNPRKISLDDEVTHTLQINKFPNFKNTNNVLKRWTRGAVKAYSRMKISHGGCLVNKANLPRKVLFSESSEKFGIGNAMDVSRKMAILSQRVLRLFFKSLFGRGILEFSELTPEEFDSTIRTVSMTDWKFITLESGIFVRCYWRLKLDNNVKWVNTHRTEKVDGYLVSSIDISTDEL